MNLRESSMPIELTEEELNNKDAKDFLLSTQCEIVQPYYEDSENANIGIFQLPESFWPRLPLGYIWVKDVKSPIPTICKNIEFPDVPVKIVIYSINSKKTAKSIDYITLFKNSDQRWVNVQSYANTKTGGAKSKDMSRSYPMTPEAYSCDGYKYMRGHCIDHADMPKKLFKVMDKDKRNYIPEDPDWGGKIRNPIVRYMIRKVEGSYMQQPYYHRCNPFDFTNEDCDITSNGTPVPLGVFFAGLSSDMSETLLALRAPWSFDYLDCKKGNLSRYKAVCSKLAIETPEEMPSPLVINPKSFGDQAKTYIKQSKKYEEEENCRAQLLVSAKSALLEYKSVEQKLKAVLCFNDIDNTIQSDAFLSDACTTATYLSKLDDKRIIFSGSILKEIKKIFSEENEREDDKVEILKKIYKDR